MMAERFDQIEKGPRRKNAFVTAGFHGNFIPRAFPRKAEGPSRHIPDIQPAGIRMIKGKMAQAGPARRGQAKPDRGGGVKDLEPRRIREVKKPFVRRVITVRNGLLAADAI